MPRFEDSATEAVLARLDGCASPRLKQIMTSVIQHLHALVREVEPTEQEWLAAIQFLTDTGQMCDDKRQEFILLSDVLGVSSLLDAINNRVPSGATESTVLGPFHVPGVPVLPLGSNIAHAEQADLVVVSGRVLDVAGQPIAGAMLDVWQANQQGFYDIQKPDTLPENHLRGRFQTDAEGKFHFVTVKPCSYPLPTDGPVGKLLSALSRHPYRPAHIHFIVTAPGYKSLTTHLFVAGDSYLDSDAVFGVKHSLVVPFTRNEDAKAAAAYGVAAPFWTVSYDFGLDPAAEAAAEAG